ncbi:MAG TPA: hypothetical protein DCY13_06305 [Verrucomicrobiales bacterium]|nr:hypothetical protein [Verrucomicrobiales bacterium]
MNPDDAKRILIRCRSGMDTADDSSARQALLLAASDPELGRWWSLQQQVQRTLRERFQELPVPDDLRDSILARRKLIRPLWWRRPAWHAAAAAAVLILLAASLLWPPGVSESVTFESFRDRMVRTVIREYRMDITTGNEADIRRFLAENDGHPNFRTSEALADLSYFGAGRLTWQDQPVSMICFERSKDVLMYLFVMNRSVLPDAPPGNEVFAQISHLATASWTDGDWVYVLASDAGMEDLQSLIR